VSECVLSPGHADAGRAGAGDGLPALAPRPPLHAPHAPLRRDGRRLALARGPKGPFQRPKRFKGLNHQRLCNGFATALPPTALQRLKRHYRLSRYPASRGRAPRRSRRGSSARSSASASATTVLPLPPSRDRPTPFGRALRNEFLGNVIRRWCVPSVGHVTSSSGVGVFRQSVMGPAPRGAGLYWKREVQLHGDEDVLGSPELEVT